VDRFIDVPDFHPAIEPEVIGQWMASHHVRLIGYTCLGLLIVLILAGFVTERTGLSTIGSLALFLPTFGYFSAYMFFLAGVGVLRLLWLPLWGPSKALLKLGDIAYLPYMAVAFPLALLGIDVREAIPLVCIGLGLFIFLLGTVAWFFGRLARKGTADFWLYRCSRHPQYLGWIMWSYGLMLLAARMPVPMAGENPGASLPWAVSTLLVICVAWSEEIRMERERGLEYEQYRRRVPFLFAVPLILSSIVTAPMRLLFNSDRPENGKQILLAFLAYALILMLFSLPFVLASWPPGPNGWFVWPYNAWPFYNRPPAPRPGLG
jgi:protein-S-isoprenylcysteine O-methyltransferase Ste14